MNITDGAPAIAWVLIPIRKADGSVRAVAIIDRQDARLTGYRWYYTRGYARRRYPAAVTHDGGVREQSMHREVMGLGRNALERIDHVNGERLDNRRRNLRLATNAQNHQNRVPLARDLPRNVYARPDGRFMAQAKLNGRSVFIGRFGTVEEADAAASAWRRENMPFSADATRARGAAT